jgi:hypothetical protein
MLISAAIFAYFGWRSWAHQYNIATTPATIIPMVVVLKWTLRGGAIAFVIAALLTWGRSMLGMLVYALAGLVTSILFVIVAIWDWNNSQFVSGVPPILLLILALWNGYGSWLGLREVFAATGTRANEAGEASGR